MDIVFENFTEKYIDEAVRLAKAEWEAECTHCPDLPCFEFEERLKQILWWLSNQNFGGKAALCDGKLVGYLLFAGPWEGMFGIGGCAFPAQLLLAQLYELHSRDRLMLPHNQTKAIFALVNLRNVHNTTSMSTCVDFLIIVYTSRRALSMQSERFYKAFIEYLSVLLTFFRLKCRIELELHL